VILPILFVALGFQPAARQAVQCRNAVDAATPALQSRSGYTVQLKVHTEDDHLKDSHACQSDYELQVTRPDGTKLAGQFLIGVDGAWGRNMKFSVEGFSADGKQAFALLDDPSITHNALMIFFYDMTTSRSTSVILPEEFQHRLGQSCAETLHVSGTALSGNPILTAEKSTACAETGSWRVTPGSLVNGIQQPSSPVPLDSKEKTTPLDPGKIVAQ
jgi:hypothetical protein